jgi:hypothetical protein
MSSLHLCADDLPSVKAGRGEAAGRAAYFADVSPDIVTPAALTLRDADC